MVPTKYLSKKVKGAWTTVFNKFLCRAREIFLAKKKTKNDCNSTKTIETIETILYNTNTLLFSRENVVFNIFDEFDNFKLEAFSSKFALKHTHTDIYNNYFIFYHLLKRMFL